MRRSASLIVGALLLALAAAGGWWLHARPGPAPGARARADAGAPRPGARRDRPERGGDPGELPRAVIDDDPPGALRLEGQVIDADSHPVAGATVAITANPARTATTEADGSFAFDHLVARPYTVVARGAQGVAGPVTARLTATSDPLVLRLGPAGKLTVTVVGTDRAPVVGATVELRGIDVQRAVTREAPVVFSPVASGAYQIAAWADGKARAFQRIVIGKGDAAARLVLSAGAPVSGRVVDARGAGIAGARVRYQGASDWTQQASERHDAVTTASDGSFRFDALPAGSFRLLASHADRAPGSSPLVTLDGRTPRDGVVITLDAGAVVSGRVVDGQHRPVGSARIRIGAAGRPGGPRAPRFEPPRQAFSAADGTFELRGLPRAALAMVALHEAGASQTTSVDTSQGDVTGVVLTLELTGTIAGTVVDPQGQPVEGAQISARPAPNGSRGGFDPAEWRLRGLAEEVSDAGGRFTLTGLAAGSYRVSAAPATRAGPRGRGSLRDGVVAETGARDVRIVLEPDGAVQGRVAFADGSAPELFTVSIQATQQSFVGGDGRFTLEGIAPGSYRLAVRGPSFQNQAADVAITASATADAGTITVVRGRSIAGVVMAGDQPVADATVYAGRAILGSGTSSAPATGPLDGQFGGGARTATTDASGAFTLSGLGDGDLTVVAEHEAIGRSRALRLTALAPGQTELTLLLEKAGALSGVLRQGGAPADGVTVTCQASATPGAVFTVVAGSDGAFRFDRLAPDTYKVSATLGTLRTGMRLYSKQVDVPAGREITVELAIDPGTVSLEVALAPSSGAAGAASVWLASGAIAAATASELSLRLAGAGPGSSAHVAVGPATPARFTELRAGDYTVCVTPLPAEVRGPAARSYLERHADALAVFCRPVALAPAPAAQSVQVPIVVPALIPDPPGAPSSGPGPGTGSP